MLLFFCAEGADSLLVLQFDIVAINLIRLIFILLIVTESASVLIVSTLID